MTETLAETDLRARIQEAMLAHAAIEPRGWDSERRRAELSKQIDELLDRLSAREPPREL